MKRLAVFVVSLFLVMTFAKVLFASEETTSSKARQITGNVTAIDTGNNTVTVRKKDREVIITVEDKTKIIQCTMKTSITDIKIGDKVTARYNETDDKNTAKSFTIKATAKKRL